MRTLEQLKKELEALGFEGVRLEKSWKRKDHREALIRGIVRCDRKAKAKERKAQMELLLAPFAADTDGCATSHWGWCAADPFNMLEMVIRIELPISY
jgi:hypothetical protein